MGDMQDGEIDLTKHHRGDRRDGVLLRNLDGMHIITPLLFPNRCNNEAYINEIIDTTNLDAWIENKNKELRAKAEAENDENFYKYTVFHVIVAAILKTIMHRDLMNRFIVNGKMYQKRELSASFVVKKKFEDNSEEGLAVIKATPTDNIESIHEKIKENVFESRSGKVDSTSDSMDIIGKLPFFLTRFVVWACRQLDKHGRVPKSFVETDPSYTSVVLSNVGSIGMNGGYHHLFNWGTNSVFCLVGKKQARAFFDDDGKVEMRESIELGLTIDERLADGFYYSRSIMLAKKLLENPELLEHPFEEKVEF